MAKTSIIVTHWAQDEERSETMRKSIVSLLETVPDAEIIVVDNGANLDDSEFLLLLAHARKIACYARNRKNMHFWFARNQGYALSSGEYLVFADNDILYESGWLEECIGFLERNFGNYLATPLEPDPMNRRDVRWGGEKDGWKLNMRAGSDCFV